MKQTIVKKIVIFSLLALSQAVLLYFYMYNENFINAFKISYIKSIYLPVYEAQLKPFLNARGFTLANVAGNSNSEAQGNLSAPCGRAQYPCAKSIPVLLYHGVVESWDDSNVLLDDFRKQMFALKQNGWNTISIDDFNKFIRGEKNLPAKSFLLTFDDGRKDSFYPVDIILKSLDFRATIFIITGHSLNDYIDNFYLSKDELLRMKKSGRWDIEAHTRNGHDFYVVNSNGKQGHFYTNKLWLSEKNRLETTEEYETRILLDFKGAKSDLETSLGNKVIGFAFPFGDYGLETINFDNSATVEKIVLKDVSSVYSLYFYQVTPGNKQVCNYPNKNSGLIGRINVRPDWTPEYLITLLDSSAEKDLPFKDNFRDYTGWLKMWGNLTYGSNLMRLSSSQDSRGSSVYLDGGSFWKDYAFSVNFDWTKGKEISLEARVQDPENFATCAYDDNSIRITQNIGGVAKNLIEEANIYVIPRVNANLSMVVASNTVDCYIGNTKVAHAENLSPALDRGSVGIETWDDISENAMSVKGVTVVQGQYIVNKAVQVPKLLIAKIPQSFQKPVQPIYFKGANWNKWYGDISVEKNGLLISANTSSSSGGGIILAGKHPLKNYSFEAMINWLKGESIQVIARYSDENNYLYCSFTKTTSAVTVAANKIENGKKFYISEKTINFTSPSTSATHLGIKVNGPEVDCLYNSSTISGVDRGLSEKLWSGVAGLETWDQRSGNSEILLKDYKITAI